MSVSTDLFLEYKKRPGRAVLARLLERHQDAVYALCYRVLRHPQDAEDACQDVLLEVSRQVDTIEQPAGFAGWLYRTALHTALDVKRKRGRLRIREAAAGRAPCGETDSIHDELQQGLAGLDETSRMLVVEHYFAQRPLRELAEERGCSEVAVWKRIRNARERLRRTIGSTAMSALVETANVQAPAGVLRSLALQGGLAMAAKTGIKIAIAAPLLLLAGAGTIVYVRQPETPALRPEAQKRTAAAPTVPAPEIPAASPVAAASAAPKPAARKPYPLALPNAGGSDAAREAWRRIGERRLTLDFTNEPMEKVLQGIAAELGIPLMILGIRESTQVSFKVKDLTGDGCLRLLLGPREMSYEIRSDGTVAVGPHDQITGGYEEIGRAMVQPKLEINMVRQELDQGWDGIKDLADRRYDAESALRTKKVTLHQGVTTWNEIFDRLNSDYGQSLVIDAAVSAPVREACDKPFLQVIDEPKLGALVERVARELGLSWCLLDSGTVFLAPESEVARARADAHARSERRRQDLDSLQKPVEGSGATTISDLLDSVSRTHGLKIMPEEEVWESSTPLTISAGTPLRQALDQLRAFGFRWAIRNGSLYVVR